MRLTGSVELATSGIFIRQQPAPFIRQQPAQQTVLEPLPPVRSAAYTSDSSASTYHPPACWFYTLPNEIMLDDFDRCVKHAEEETGLKALTMGMCHELRRAFLTLLEERRRASEAEREYVGPNGFVTVTVNRHIPPGVVVVEMEF
jgi:hypothetical protein